MQLLSNMDPRNASGSKKGQFFFTNAYDHAFSYLCCEIRVFPGPRLRVSQISPCHALLQILGPWPWWPWLQFSSMLASPIQRRIETLLTSSNWTSRNPYSQEWGTEAVKIPTDNIKIPTENIKIPTHPIKIPTSPIKIPTSPIKIPTDQSKSLHDCRDFDCRDYDCRDFDCRDSETLPNECNKQTGPVYKYCPAPWVATIFIC